jgi:hypothetical protein
MSADRIGGRQIGPMGLPYVVPESWLKLTGKPVRQQILDSIRYVKEAQRGS